MATIKLPTPLRRFTGQRKSLEVSAGTVADALAALTQEFPDMRGVLFAEGGDLKSFIRVFVGNQDIGGLQGLQTPVATDAVIAIFPPIAGA